MPHPLGRHSPPRRDCHRILTRWQYASGICLNEHAPRTELDRTRALIVGVVHLLQLFGQRHRDRSWISAELWLYTGRVVSRLLDQLGPPNRPGRSLPDPTVPPVEAAPASWSDAAERECTREFAHLLRAVAAELGEAPPLTADTLADLTADPARHLTGFRQLASDEHATAQLLQAVDAYLDHGSRLVRQLLTVDLERLDEALLDEARLWTATARTLLEQALVLAGGTDGQVCS